MSAENCIDTTRCPSCPCLPKVTLEQAVVDLWRASLCRKMP